MSGDRRRQVKDEAELADELEEAMADPNEWGEPIRESRPLRSEKRQRAAMISIRLTAEELSAVQAQATARGLSVSGYVRDAALRPVQQSSPVTMAQWSPVNTAADTQNPVIVRAESPAKPDARSVTTTYLPLVDAS
jgi:predicted DNA binding CopG/RHH family protein